MLATYFLILIPFARASELDVDWVKPARGKIFASGEPIKCEWEAEKQVVAPSFRLCSYAGSSKSTRDSESVSRDRSGDLSDCGVKIWPAVRHDGDTYTTSMIAPDVVAEGDYCVQMTDNFEQSVCSPVFSITPKANASDSSDHAASISSPSMSSPTVPPSEAGPPVVPPPAANAQFPASAPPAVAASTTTPPPKPIPPSIPSPAASNSSPVHTPSASPYAPAPLGGGGVPSFLAAHSPPPVAAIAVPTSIAGAIVLLAAILGLDHCMKQRRLRKCEKEALAVKVACVELDEKKRKEEEKWLRERERFAAPVPLPLFLPEVGYTDIPRRAVRESFSARMQPAGMRDLRYEYAAYPSPPRHATPVHHQPHHPPLPGSPSPPGYSLPPLPSLPSLPAPPKRYSLPPLPTMTMSPLSYHPSTRHPNSNTNTNTSTLGSWTYARERHGHPVPQDDAVPVTQSVLEEYLPPPAMTTTTTTPTPPSRPPETLLSAPHLAHVRRQAPEIPPLSLSDNPYVRSARP